MLQARIARHSLVALAAVVAGCAHAAAPARAKVDAAPEPPDASVARAAAAYATLEKAEVERLSGLLDGLIADPVLVAAFRERDRETLLAKAYPKYERLREAHGITHWYFVDPEPSRVTFLRVHSPTLYGEVDTRETLTQVIANKQMAFGKELGKTAFALRVVKPIRVGGEVIGYMELAEEIGHFLLKMKEQTGDDYAVLADKRQIDRAELAHVRKEDRWDERPDVVMIDSTVWNERLVELPVALEAIPDAGVRTGEWTEGGRTFLGGAFPIRDGAGKVTGALYVRHPISK